MQYPDGIAYIGENLTEENVDFIKTRWHKEGWPIGLSTSHLTRCNFVWKPRAGWYLNPIFNREGRLYCSDFSEFVRAMDRAMGRTPEGRLV